MGKATIYKKAVTVGAISAGAIGVASVAYADPVESGAYAGLSYDNFTGMLGN